MKLGVEVDLGPDDIVLDGAQLPPKKGPRLPIFGPCLLWRNGCPSQLGPTAELLFNRVNRTDYYFKSRVNRVLTHTVKYSDSAVSYATRAQQLLRWATVWPQ